MKKILKNIIANLILLLVGFMSSFIILELFLRLPICSSKYTLASFHKYNPIQETLNDNYNVFRPSAICGYEHIPNSAPKGKRPIVTSFINSYGMVGKEYGLKKNKNTFRILILGDSITEFDWYVDGLRQRFNSGRALGYDFELWNGGVLGYAVNQYWDYFKYRGIRYNPDMLFIGFCLNDFTCDSYIVCYKDAKGFTQYYYPSPNLQRIIPTNRLLFRHSYLYRFLTVKLETLLSQLHQNGEDSDARVKTGLYFLSKIKKLCDDKKIPLFCVIFPYLKPLSEYDRNQMDDYNSMLIVLEKLGIDYLDLHLYFPESKRYDLRNNKSDDMHPSREGHEIAASAIYSHLIKNYFSGDI